MNQKEKDTLISNIKRLRKSRKLTQEQLAALLGYTKQNISNWERGKNFPSKADIEKLAEILGVKPNALLDEHEKKLQQRPESLEFIEAKEIPYKVNTYIIFFKDNINCRWTAWIHDMDYPMMTRGAFACARHLDYPAFKEDVINHIDEVIKDARDYMDSIEISDYAKSIRSTKETIEAVETLVDSPQ